MALGALDLLLVADCARIWVRSEIRDPPEASTCRDRPRLCSAVSPQSIYSCAQKAASMVFLSEGLSPLPRSHRLQKGLEDYPRRRRLLRIGFFGVFLNFLQPLKPDWLKSISWFH
ncbi:unnamed protein product [Brassica napus]|uniref:Uncharacterized protein n=3 Tax=Brassica TaxID=3705 RepID=M4D8F9_BRACM|nr:unnamed protein product [Brassica napus]